jgi:hypothetical protein
MANGFNNQPPAIGGIISTKPSAKYISGARCLIKVNGQLVGFAFGISWNINNSVTRINTIDDYNSYELAPKRVDVSGSLSCFHIPGQGPGAGLLQADILSFLFQKYITIECRDSRTNQLLFLTDKAMITSRGQNVTAEQLSQITLNWEAIGYQDEREPLPPTGYDQLSPPPRPPITGGLTGVLDNNSIPSVGNLVTGRTA